MSEQISPMTAEPETGFQWVTRVARDERSGEEHASLLGLLSRYAPEQYALLREDRDIDVLRSALDERIRRDMGGSRSRRAVPAGSRVWWLFDLRIVIRCSISLQPWVQT